MPTIQEELNALRLKDELIGLQLRDKELSEKLEMRDTSRQIETDIQQDVLPQPEFETAEPSASYVDPNYEFTEQPKPIDPERHERGKQILAEEQRSGKSAYDLGQSGFLDGDISRPDERGIVSTLYRKAITPQGDISRRALGGMTREEVKAREYEEGQSKSREIARAQQVEADRLASERAKFEGTGAPFTIAEPDISTVRPPDDAEIIPLAKQKWEETKETAHKVIEAVKNIPWQTVREELAGGVVEDAPIIALGFGALGMAKRAATTGKAVTKARKLVQLQKQIKKMPVEQRKDLLTYMAGRAGITETEFISQFGTTPIIAQKVVAEAAKFPAKFPKLAETANIMAETGIILTPGMIKNEELPSLEETAATAGITGVLRYMGRAWRRYRAPKDLQTRKPIYERGVSEEPTMYKQPKALPEAARETPKGTASSPSGPPVPNQPGVRSLPVEGLPVPSPKPTVAKAIPKTDVALKGIPEPPPKSILDPIGTLDERISVTQGQHKRDLVEMKELLQDDVIPGIVKPKVFDKSLNYLAKNNKPYTFIYVDGRNVTGANKFFAIVGTGHEGTNEILRKTWGDIFQKRIQKEGGLVSRDQGDELRVLLPGKTEEEAHTIMQEISTEIEKVLESAGLSKITHEKTKLPESGALQLDYGIFPGGKDIAKVQSKADALSTMAKEKYAKKLADKHNLIYDSKRGIYVERTSTPEIGPSPQQQPRRSIEAPGREGELDGGKSVSTKRIEAKAAEKLSPLPFTPTRAKEIADYLRLGSGLGAARKALEFHQANPNKVIPKRKPGGNRDAKDVKIEKSERINDAMDRMSQPDSEYGVEKVKTKISDLPREFTVDGHKIRKFKSNWNFVDKPLGSNKPFDTWDDHIYIDKVQKVKPPKPTPKKLTPDEEKVALAKKQEGMFPEVGKSKAQAEIAKIAAQKRAKRSMQDKGTQDLPLFDQEGHRTVQDDMFRGQKGAVTIPTKKELKDAAKRIKEAVIPTKQTDTSEFKMWFGESKISDSKNKPLRVFRGDFNVKDLNKFEAKSFDSGANFGDGSGAIYFTDNPEIASGYTNKQFFESSYDDPKFFKFKYKGKQYTVGDKILLDAKSKKKMHSIIEKEFYVPKGRIQSDLVEAGYNPVLGAYKSLVESGAIYPADDFSEFLKKVFDYGIYEDPEFGRKGVSAVYLKMEKPWSLKNPNKKDLAILNKLKDDVTVESLNKKETVVSVTNKSKLLLKKLGYDGIIDETGGTIMGGDKHNVYIVFEPTQIKSATGNRGKFDPTNPDIRGSITIPTAAELKEGVKNLFKPLKLKPEASKKAKSIEAVFDWQKKEVAKKNRISGQQIKDVLGSGFVQYEYPLARRLLNSPEGEKAVHFLQLSRGASPEAGRLYKEAAKEIWGSFPREAKELFNNLLQAHRVIEVEKVKADKALVRAMTKKARKIEIAEGVYDEALPSEFNKAAFIKSPKGKGAADMSIYIESVKKQYPEVYPKLEKAMKRYWKEAENQVMAMHEEGLLSDDLAQYLLENHKHYSPRLFIQHMDPTRQGFSDMKSNKISVSDSGIKPLDEGSEGALINDAEFLLESVIQRSQGRIFRNRANRELYKFAEKYPENEAGIVIEPLNDKGEYGEIPDDMTRFSYMEKGEKKNILIPDEMAKYWASSNPLIAGALAKILRTVSLAPLLRAGATGLNPEFALGNIPRDVFYTWFKQHEAYSSILPVGLYQIAKDMKAVAKDAVMRKGLTEAYYKAGGGMDFLTQQGYIYQKPLGLPTGEIRKGLATAQDILGYIGNTSELIPRLALMKRMMDQGKTAEEAAYIARTNLDFSQGGSIVKAIDQVIPYMSAGVQGTRGVFQAFKSNPKLATWKMSQIMAAASALTIFGYMWYEDEMEKIPDWEKRTGWIIPLGITVTDQETGSDRHAYIKIPKDHGQMLFAQFGEQMTKAIMQKEPSWTMIQDAFLDAAPNIASRPPTLEAIMTYMYNKDFYRNKDLWKGRDVSPEFEKYPSTSEAWKQAGKLFGISPVRGEAAAKKVFPKNIYTDVAGGGWDAMTNALSGKEKADFDKTIWEKLSKWPGARRYLRLTWADRGGDEVKEFKKAVKLGIPTHTEDGKELSRDKLKKEVEKAELKANDVKQQNDYDLSYEIERSELIGDDKKARKHIVGFINKFEKSERKRLISRYKKIAKKKNRLNNKDIKEILSDAKSKYMGAKKKEESERKLREEYQLQK